MDCIKPEVLPVLSDVKRSSGDVTQAHVWILIAACRGNNFHSFLITLDLPATRRESSEMTEKRQGPSPKVYTYS